MNKICILIYVYVFFLQMISLDLYSQIGINTMNPSGMFNIKPDGDKQTSDVSKELIFTKDGLLGLGTDSPKAQLHIVSKDKSPFRLTDNSQGKGRVLTSDANGNAHWGVMQGTGGEIFDFPPIPTITYPKGVISNLSVNGIIYNIYIGGNYLLFIRICGKTTGLASSSTTTSSSTINFYLKKNEDTVDAIRYLAPVGNTGSYFNFTIMLGALNCISGDSLQILVQPIDGDLILNSENSHRSKLSIFAM